jgi:hypothetical protein
VPAAVAATERRAATGDKNDSRSGERQQGEQQPRGQPSIRDVMVVVHIAENRLVVADNFCPIVKVTRCVLAADLRFAESIGVETTRLAFFDEQFRREL